MSSVLFVCLGNICRSPLAEGVFRDAVARAGLSDRFTIDSAGTGDWHTGNSPDPRSVRIARENGIDISGQRARTVRRSDFTQFNLILCMDHDNLERVSRLGASEKDAHVDLFVRYALDEEMIVPDPYYGGDEGFERCYDLVSRASQALLEKLR